MKEIMNGSRILTIECARLSIGSATGSEKLEEKSMKMAKAEVKVSQVKVFL